MNDTRRLTEEEAIALAAFANNLKRNQVELDPDAKRALWEHIWDLYTSED